MAKIPAAQGAYGAQGPLTGGSTPKVGYPTGQTSPTPTGYETPAKSTVAPATSSPTTASDPRTASAASAPPSPPPGYIPSVNRDGSIPNPATVAPTAAPAAPAAPAPSTAADPKAGVSPPLQAAGKIFSGVDPARQYSPQEALAEIERQVGRPLTPEEIKVAQGMIGPGPYTGQHINQLLQVAVQRTPNAAFAGFGSQPGGAGAPGFAGFEATVQNRLTPTPPLPTTDLPTYQAQPFQDPTDPAMRQQLTSLINSILASPESLNPQVIAQLKERGKEDILSQSAQLRNELAQGAASRGTYGGGNMAANQRRAADATVGDLTRNNREVDINAAATNMADRRAAGELGNKFLTDTTNRGQGIAEFNRDDNRFAFGSEVDKVNFALQRALSQAGLQQGDLDAAIRAWQVGTQRDLGTQGLGLDQQKINNQASQFGQAHQLDWVRALNDMVMGRAGYGLDLAQLQQNSQNSMFDWMFNQGRG
jgi:hypothetical protein